MKEIVKEKRKRLGIVLSAIAIVMTVFGLIETNRSRKIVQILDKDHRVDRIAISRGDVDVVVAGDKLERYKEAFEPQVILSGDRKTINKVLGDKYLEMRFFIEDELLFSAATYELTTDSDVSGSFEMGNRRYIMKVGRDYRGLSKSDKGFLLEAVTACD
jgi:hypothetical protein